MHPTAYQNAMIEAARLQSEAIARIEAKVDGLVERLDRPDEAAADRPTPKRSPAKS